MAHEASVIACVLVALATPALADKHYTLPDLETLVADRSYEEAVAHLGDIAPSQRTPKWTEVASSATAGFLGTLPDESKLPAIDAIDRMYPTLLKAPGYAKARAQHGTTGLASCYRTWNASECTKLGTRLADGGDRALVLDVARTSANHDSTLSVSLFKRVLDKSICRDDALRRATISSLERITPATDARAIVQTCWDDLKGKVIEAFDQASKGSYVYRNTCDILEGKGVLSSLQQKRCRK